MPQLNHTIVWCRDKVASTEFVVRLFDLPPPIPYGPFLEVELPNSVILAYHELQPHEPIAPQHYAFLVTEREFDEVFGRLLEQGLRYWADPAQRQPGEINHEDGGRGVYWEDPDHHFLEMLTRPYGSGPLAAAGH